MTITAITEKTISTETEMGELLVKILHRLDRQVQKTEFLQAENAELRARVEKLERERNKGEYQLRQLDKSGNYLPEPLHSSTARKS